MCFIASIYLAFHSAIAISIFNKAQVYPFRDQLFCIILIAEKEDDGADYEENHIK